MKKNRVKQALAEGKVQLGTGFGQLPCPEIAKILAAAGFDWTFIDTEHGCFNPETINNICKTATEVGLCPIVRVVDLQYALVARTLDLGAEGVLFPRVESPELLEKAVSWTKFPPVGIRGCGLTPSHLNYVKATVAEVIEHMNANVMVVLQIETRRAVEARDELLSIPGIDVVMVGPVDLSISLGVPGDFQHPAMVDAMEKIRDSCISHGVAPGTQTRTPQLAKFWRERGMRFLGCSNETGMLFDRAAELVAQLR
jgi:2-dehydro-3-deoxyglucarate aldolase/4-hydroxy-2-oxoheptanedioate aldolase